LLDSPFLTERLDRERVEIKICVRLNAHDNSRDHDPTPNLRPHIRVRFMLPAAPRRADHFIRLPCFITRSTRESRSICSSTSPFKRRAVRYLSNDDGDSDAHAADTGASAHDLLGKCDSLEHGASLGVLLNIHRLGNNVSCLPYSIPSIAAAISAFVGRSRKSVSIFIQRMRPFASSTITAGCGMPSSLFPTYASSRRA